MQISDDTALGAAPLTTTANNIIIDGGVLSVVGTTTLNSNRGILLGSASGSSSGSIDVLTGSTLTYGGIVADNGVGADGLLKTGLGSLILQGANTYAGATVLYSGTLQVANSNALGTTAGGVTVFSGAALELAGNVAVGAEALLLNGTGIASGGALRSVGGVNSYAGVITLGSSALITSDAQQLTLNGGFVGNSFDLTFGGAGTVVVAAPVNGSVNSLTKQDGGSLILQANNAYTGATTLNGGTTELIAAGRLSGTGASSLADNAVLRISNTVAANLTDRISDAAGITSSGGGISFLHDAGAVDYSEVLGTLTLTGGLTQITTTSRLRRTNEYAHLCRSAS